MRQAISFLLLSCTLHLGCSSSPGEGAGGGSSTSSSSGDTAGSSTTSSVSTGGPTGDGCERGLVRCGDTCRDIQNDSANCGACGNECGVGDACLLRGCRTPEMVCNGPGTIGTLCGGSCVLTSQNLDHCGACDHPCGAESYCGEDNGGTCKPWQGHGTSCASPIVLTDTGNFSADFWFVDGGAPLLFSCGALEPRPTVTFRWTCAKTDSGQKFKVDGADIDDLVIEVFSAAPCTSATSLGCNNDQTATKLTPQLQIPVEAGKSYYIVVGSIAKTAPPGRFSLHIDD